MPAYPKPVKQPKTKHRRKPTKRQQLIRRADAAIRAYVLGIEKRCIVCGKDSNIQLGHLFTRSKYSVRWSRANCHAQCSGCNMMHEFDPHPYTMKFIDRFGLEEYRKLYAEAETPRKWTLDDIEEIAMMYEEMTK